MAERGVLAPIRRAIAPLLEHEQLLMISIATVLVMAGQGVISPVLPIFAKKFGIGSAAVGLTLSAFALARLLLNVPLGVLSDRYGRRALLIGGPVVTAVGMFGTGFSRGFMDLLAWRFVAGAGSAMYMTGAQIYLTDISTAATRARFIGTNQGALLIGTAIGPGIGGLVAEVWGLRAPFYLVGVAAIVAAGYCFVRIPETRHLAAAAAADERARQQREGVPHGRPWVRMIRSRDFGAVSFVTMTIFFTRTASRQTLMPLYASARLGMSTGMLGVLFTVMSLINVILVAPSAWIADRWGRKAAIVPATALMGVSLGLMALTHTTSLFVVSAVVLATATSIAGPAPAAYAADIAPPDVRGLAMGMYRTSGDIGFLIGPPLLGALADATSYGTGLTANGILLAVGAVVFLTIARETVTRQGARA